MRIDDAFWRSVRLYPQTPAVVDDQCTLSFAELGQRVARLCALMHSTGVAAGDRVAVLAKNRWEYLALYMAAASVDAVVVPLNWRLSVPELQWILNDAEPRVVVAAAPFAQQIDRLRGEVPSVRDWIALDEAPECWSHLPDLLAHAPLHSALHQPAPSRLTDASEFAQVYTSGTTGRPKGALLTHANVSAGVVGLIQDFDMRAGQDKFMQVTPLFHVGGLLATMICMTLSVTVRLLPEFEPGAAARCMATEGISQTLMVPAMLRWMLTEPALSSLQFPQLRTVVYGAAPMPEQTLVMAAERLRCRFVQGYGLSETGGILTVLSPQDHVLDGSAAARARLVSAGREMLGAQIRVVDADGHDVPTGELGEVVARGACVSPGYWKLPEATKASHRDGWFWTGDIGFLDEQRFLTIVDRSKDMIVLGGENIYPREIELALLTHPAIADCAVIGIPHETWGEEVLAFVALQPGATFEPRVYIAHCRQQLARYKCPTQVLQLDAIPRNAAGKIEKPKLREPYWARQAKQV
jgi:long-chain acyl-CoA synthetase